MSIWSKVTSGNGVIEENTEIGPWQWQTYDFPSKVTQNESFKQGKTHHRTRNTSSVIQTFVDLLSADNIT